MDYDRHHNPSTSGETVFEPAQSITINGEDNIVKLRDACNEALEDIKEAAKPKVIG